MLTEGPEVQSLNDIGGQVEALAMSIDVWFSEDAVDQVKVEFLLASLLSQLGMST